MSDHDDTEREEAAEFIQCPHEMIRATCVGGCNCPCDPCAPSRPKSTSLTADRNVVAEDGYQERDDCAEAVAAARAEGDEAVRIWHSQYSRVRAECDALRAAIEALAAEYEASENWRGWGIHYRLRAALEATP